MRIVLLLAFLALAVPSQAGCTDELTTFLTKNTWVGFIRGDQPVAINEKVGCSIDQGNAFALEIETVVQACGSNVLGSYVGLLKEMLCLQDQQQNYCLGSVLALLDVRAIIQEAQKDSPDLEEYFLNLDWRTLLTNTEVAQKVCQSRECAYKIVRKVSHGAREIANNYDFVIDDEIKLVSQVAETFMNACPTDGNGESCAAKKNEYFNRNGELLPDSCDTNGELKPCARRLAANMGSFAATPNNNCGQQVFEAGKFTFTLPNLDYKEVIGVKDMVLGYLAKDTAMIMNMAADNAISVSPADLLLVDPILTDANPGCQVTFTVAGPGLTLAVMDVVAALENLPFDNTDWFFFETDMRLESKYYVDASDLTALTGSGAVATVTPRDSEMPTVQPTIDPSTEEDGTGSGASTLHVGAALSLAIMVAAL